jgi:hypothetical protein
MTRIPSNSFDALIDLLADLLLEDLANDQDAAEQPRPPPESEGVRLRVA